MFDVGRSFLISMLFFCFILGTSRSEIFGKSKNTTKGKTSFSSLTFNPVSGKKPESIVVLLHGYGDNSENFLMVGALLSQFLPDTLFVAIDGPIACNLSGKQWLSTPKNDKPKLLKEIKTLTPSLHQYIKNLLEKYKIPFEKLAFLGFSQGARIALHIGLRSSKCAGIVAISGSYLDDPATADLSRPPILIIHGTEDTKASVDLAKMSYKQLKTLKMPVTLAILPKADHEVTPQAIELAGEFLKDCLEK